MKNLLCDPPPPFPYCTKSNQKLEVVKVWEQEREQNSEKQSTNFKCTHHYLTLTTSIFNAVVISFELSRCMHSYVSYEYTWDNMQTKQLCCIMAIALPIGNMWRTYKLYCHIIQISGVNIVELIRTTIHC